MLNVYKVPAVAKLGELGVGNYNPSPPEIFINNEIVDLTIY